MPYDPILALKMAAFSAGQNAKINDLDEATVEELRIQVERVLDDPQDPLRQAVIRFVVQYEIEKLSKNGLLRLGCDLVDFLHGLNMPMPPDVDRKDIYG